MESDELKIAFVGTIYEWHPIKSFLTVLAEYNQKFPENKIKFNLYGINISDDLNSMLTNEFSSLKDSVVIYPKLPNLSLLKELAKHNLMLLFNYYAYTGTKIYDYIGIKRKILLCYSDDKEANELKRKHYNLEIINKENEKLQEELKQL